jgi:GTP-binding protein
MKFIDEIAITIRSGHGGPGKVSFRREKFVPRGGPDGGDGGRGGNVIFQASPHLKSLLDYHAGKVYAAENGQPGELQLATGANGKDLILMVPPGTIVKTPEGEVLADLDSPDARIELLKGGRGGKGNAFFKTSTNQAPMHAQPGEPYEIKDVVLELKLLANIGIVGYPNAGKSTLISRISAARPKIAEYPFTTLVPNLGVVRIDPERSMVIEQIFVCLYSLCKYARIHKSSLIISAYFFLSANHLELQVRQSLIPVLNPIGLTF